MKQINLLPQSQSIKYEWIIAGTSSLMLAIAASYYFFKEPTVSIELNNNFPHHLNAAPEHLFIDYSIPQLKAVGYLKYHLNKDTEVIYALVQSPDHNVTTVKVGDLLGQEKIKVVQIASHAMHLQSDPTHKPLVINLSQHQA